MAKIKQLTDKHGEVVYPVSKETAIYDDNGVLLSNKISTFITRLVDNLANYYLKSEIYTKEEIDTLIGAIQGFSYIVVSELPTASAFTMGTIYLVPSADPQTQNTKDEYITIRSGSIGSYTYSWEQIGSTAIDLSGYVTTEALNTELTKYTTTANLTTLLAAKQDTIADLSTIRSGASAGATAYQKPASGIPASDIASGVIPTVPTISTDVSADAASDVKTSSPKSVKTYVDAGIAAVESDLSDLADEVESIDIGAYEVAWDGNSEPVVANIPAGVVVTYGGSSYTGTLAAGASTKQKIYLVATGTTDNYDRYVTVGDSTYSWANLGTTEITLANYATKTQANQLEAKVDDIDEKMPVTGRDITETIDKSTTNPGYGKYIQSNGSVASYGSYMISNPITLRAGERFVSSVRAGSTQIFAKYLGNYTTFDPIDGYFVGGNTTYPIDWVADEDCQVVVCGDYSSLGTYSISSQGYDYCASKSATILGWIISETFTASSITRDSSGAVSSAVVAWPDGESGTIAITRNELGSATSVVAVYDETTYTMTINRDSNNNVTSYSIA